MNKGNKMRSVFLLITLVMLAGCKQDPYPDTGDWITRAPSTPHKVEPPLSMAVDDVIEYYEGRELEYGIRVSVKEPGFPEVNIDNLPPGAEFDDQKMILKWRPGYFDGNNPKDPAIKSRIYPITIWLRSSLDTTHAIKKQVSLVVHDVSRSVEVEGRDAKTVYEGNKFSYDFKINNLDYPQGPFKVITAGMPANTKIIKIDENNFRLEFTPDYYHVNLYKDGNSKSYQGVITVSSPANHVGTKEVDITVYDKRLDSKLVTPDNLVQGLDVSFQVAGYDLNKEVTPKIELLSSRPGYGHFKVKLVKNEENNSSVLNVEWNDIPPTHNGETVRLKFRSCVLSSRWNYGNCETGFTDIKIVVRDRKPPTIHRNSWPVGEMIYLGFNEFKMKTMYVKDGEDPSIKPKVEIFPKSIRKHVTWSGGSLKMKFNESGVFQFNVLATSDYMVSTSESFLVEVFPEDRAKILFFADSTRDPEVHFYKQHLKDVSLMNPLIQQINTRNVSDRDTLVLGTSVLFDKKAAPQILKAIALIENIVIASPLIDNMPEKFLAELKDSYHLGFIGRWNSISRAPELAKTHFAFTKQFRTPRENVSLNMNASSESWNPLVFNGGLDDPTKICKGVLGLTVDGNSPFVLGVSCKRNNGGRITLLGTEWADLKVGTNDGDIPAAWFNTMLKGRF